MSMQDLAQEITSLIEPSEPIGYRLLMYHRMQTDRVLFEAKPVAFKGRIAFLVRSVESEEEAKDPPLVSKLATTFAPTEDALKFMVRKTYNLCWLDEPYVVIEPPDDTSHDFFRDSGSVRVDLANKWERLEVGEHDSRQERILRETIAALTLMKVPDWMKQ